MYKTILVTGTIMFSITLSFSQIVWNEDFAGYGVNKTIIGQDNNLPAGVDWTTIATDCDGGGSIVGTVWVGADHWGTEPAGRFLCNDVEGGPCCGMGGTCNNLFTTELIDISAYGGVRISIDVSHSGGQEAGALVHCDNAIDMIQFSYSIDGGPFTQFAINGFLNGNWPTPLTVNQACLLGGTTLQVRFVTGNKANTEFVRVDNIVVDATTCPPLPVELTYFNIQCYSDNNIEVIWNTASEINNSHFIIQGSIDANIYVDMQRVEGNGNSNNSVNYSTVISNANNYNYFRLVQVDYNGDATDYSPRYLECKTLSENKFRSNIYNNELQLLIPNDVNGEFEINMADMNGKSLIVSNHSTSEKTLSIPLAIQLTNGIYLISLRELVSNRTYYSKVFVN